MVTALAFSTFVSWSAPRAFLLVATFLDKAALAQRLKMATHGRKGNARRLREIASLVSPLAEEVENALAVRVGERRKRASRPCALTAAAQT